MRLRPYRTAEDRIQGVVATFTDITARRRAEEAMAADLRDTTLLRDLALRLVPDGDIQTLYQEIMAAAIALTRADAGTVQILDDESRELVLLASHGFADEMRQRFRRVDANSNTPCGVALARNERTFMDFDVPEAADPQGSMRMHVEAGYLSGQSTPLVSRSGRAIGMVTTHWREHRRPSERELRFLDLLIRQAADLIEQQRAQVALRESEQRFRMLVQNVHDYAIFMIDAKGLVTEWTEGAERVKGYTAEEVIGRHFSLFYAPEEIAARQPERELATATATGRSEAEGWRIRKSGERFLVNEIATAIRDDNGKLVGFTKISRDITEKKRAEAAYRVSEERLRLTLESVTDYAIFTMDAAGRIDSWPPGAQRTFGFTEEEAIGQSTAIIFTAEDRAADVPEHEMRTARERGRAADERWHVRKDGARFYVSGVLAPLRHGGVVTGYAKVARDLTRQKFAEDEVRRAREDLEKRVQERTRELAALNESLRREAFERQRVEDARVFLLRQLVNAQEGERRRISRELHDQLGQQVSALVLKLSILKKDAKLSTSAREELENLEELATQLDSDLDFLVWELRPTALDDLGLVEALSDYAANWSKHFNVPVDLDAHDMQEARLEPEIETVLYRMTQEALNNVAKHALAKHVQITLTSADEEVSLTVADDGVGFDNKQPFGTGTKGLGLVGMRERAALGGGSVAITSKPGHGTKVLLRMPVHMRGSTPARGDDAAHPERRSRSANRPS
jgi:PAS domain S-box-containing protein